MSVAISEQYDKIYRYCYFKVRQPQLAEDLTQETFLRFFSQATYINRGKPLAYLYTIARNLCVDACIAAGKEATCESVEIAYDDDRIKTLETSIIIKAALEALTVDEQELILLRYINDLSMAEISLLTGLSRFAIRRKINGAIKKLKESLREEDF